MKVLIGILVVIGVIFGVWKIWDYWETVNKEKMAANAAATQVEDSSNYEGMPYTLEQPLAKARAAGTQSFKQWLDTYRHLIKDPRLAALELDYIVAITRENPVEAKRMFAEVKKRIPPGDKLAKRIESLSKSYE